MYRYLLLVRFGLFNLVAVSLVIGAFLQGWLDVILGAKLVEFSALIGALFVYGLVYCAARIWMTTIELNDVTAATPAPDSYAGRYLSGVNAGAAKDILMSVLRLKLTNRIVIVSHIANALVFLGLIGTVIGFIIALSGVNPASVTDAENVGAMVSNLITGMSVALNTTLVGAVLYVWLIVNHRLLANGTVNLLTSTVELGERASGLGERTSGAGEQTSTVTTVAGT